MELDEIKRRIESGDIRMSDALARALPKFRGLVSDATLEWCSNELQGYSNALEFYQRKAAELPGYRVVSGGLKVVQSDGSIGEIRHALANRTEFFLSAPLAWLEDFYSVSGETSIVDLPELTTYIGRQSGGTIVCECSRSELQKILGSFQSQFFSIIDSVIAAKLSKTSAAPAPQWGFASSGSQPAPEAYVQQAPVWTPDVEEPRGPSAFDIAHSLDQLGAYSGHVAPPPVQEEPKTTFIGAGGGRREDAGGLPDVSSLRSKLASDASAEPGKKDKKQTKLEMEQFNEQLQGSAAPIQNSPPSLLQQPPSGANPSGVDAQNPQAPGQSHTQSGQARAVRQTKSSSTFWDLPSQGEPSEKAGPPVPSLAHLLNDVESNLRPAGSGAAAPAPQTPQPSSWTPPGMGQPNNSSAAQWTIPQTPASPEPVDRVYHPAKVPVPVPEPAPVPPLPTPQQSPSPDNSQQPYVSQTPAVTAWKPMHLDAPRPPAPPAPVAPPTPAAASPPVPQPEWNMPRFGANSEANSLIAELSAPGQQPFAPVQPAPKPAPHASPRREGFADSFRNSDDDDEGQPRFEESLIATPALAAPTANRPVADPLAELMAEASIESATTRNARATGDHAVVPGPEQNSNLFENMLSQIPAAPPNPAAENNSWTPPAPPAPPPPPAPRNVSAAESIPDEEFKPSRSAHRMPAAQAAQMPNSTANRLPPLQETPAPGALAPTAWTPPANLGPAPPTVPQPASAAYSAPLPSSSQTASPQPDLVQANLFADMLKLQQSSGAFPVAPAPNAIVQPVNSPPMPQPQTGNWTGTTSGANQAAQTPVQAALPSIPVAPSPQAAPQSIEPGLSPYAAAPATWPASSPAAQQPPATSQPPSMPPSPLQSQFAPQPPPIPQPPVNPPTLAAPQSQFAPQPVATPQPAVAPPTMAPAPAPVSPQAPPPSPQQPGSLTQPASGTLSPYLQGQSSSPSPEAAKLFADMLKVQHAQRGAAAQFPNQTPAPVPAPPANSQPVWVPPAQTAPPAPSVLPVLSAAVKMKAGELLAQAYSAPQLSISTTELTAPDAPTTQTIAAAVNYMLRMSWIRAVPETNSFALTQEGIQHIEQSLAF